MFKSINSTICFLLYFSLPHHSSRYVDVAYCYWPSSVVCRSVGWSVTLMSRTKTAKAIEMLFGLWIEDLGGPREP